jgi:hypothetical protein
MALYALVGCRFSGSRCMWSAPVVISKNLELNSASKPQCLRPRFERLRPDNPSVMCALYDISSSPFIFNTYRQTCKCTVCYSCCTSLQAGNLPTPHICSLYSIICTPSTCRPTCRAIVSTLRSRMAFSLLKIRSRCCCSVRPPSSQSSTSDSRQQHTSSPRA